MPTVDSATAILIRVPAELKSWVEGEAEDNNRSMSQEVCRMIQQERARRATHGHGATHEHRQSQKTLA